MESLYFILFAVLCCFHCCLSQLSLDRNELLNWCLKSMNHKHYPGKEDSLHQQCRPWKGHACCTESVTYDIHQLNMYNFTYDHCYDQVKMNMSAQCKRHFIQDNCFYECEPHIGLWVVNTTRKITSERFYKVPLCASECDSWFDACKDDYTCVHNWPREFVFKNGHNVCPADSKCQKFKDVYKSSKDFCENVWDYSWKYTQDDEPCMHMWFGEDEADANRKTAEHYVDNYLNMFHSNSVSLHAGATSVIVFAITCFYLRNH